MPTEAAILELNRANTIVNMEFLLRHTSWGNRRGSQIPREDAGALLRRRQVVIVEGFSSTSQDPGCRAQSPHSQHGVIQPASGAGDEQGTSLDPETLTPAEEFVAMSKRLSQVSGSVNSGSVKSFDTTGRVKGSTSATAPTLISPMPSRSFQTQLSHIENTMNNKNDGQVGSAGGGSQGTPSGSSQHHGGVPVGPRGHGTGSMQPPLGPSRGPSNHQGQGRVVHTSGSNRGNSSNTSLNNQNNTQNSKPGELSVHFRTKVRAIQKTFMEATGVPSATKETVKQEIIKIIQEFDEAEARLKQEYINREKENNLLKQQYAEAQRQLKNLIDDRSRISKERDDLLLKVGELMLKTKTSSERIKITEKKWIDINNKLMDKIHFQDEQLKGKRALWLDANPTSSARRDAMTAIRDPFDSPSVNHTAGSASNNLATMGSFAPSPLDHGVKYSETGFGNSIPKSAAPPKMHYPPPAGSSGKGVRRRPAMNLPTGRASQNYEPLSMQDFAKSSRTFHTEPADDIPSMTTPSTALVLHSKEEHLAIEYKLAFNKLYAMIETWARKYCDTPNAENDRVIASSNQLLWEYMMNCTYPGHRQDSHNHVVAVLNDARSRFWFIVRMAATYCTKDITNADAFMGFSPEVDRVLKEVKAALLERGLANERRQVLIDQQARAVQSVISAATYGEFRCRELNRHTKSLRDMLGPLLNEYSPRAVAGQELGAIVIIAWDLTVKMNTSHLTFQVYFPETCSKFTAATMNAKDSTANAMQLQIRQTRLKLVVTPVITMRDDRGTTIMAKSIMQSDVLLMN